MSRRRTIRTPPSPVPTHRLSNASPSSILCHSVANPVPIRCQSCANLIPIRPLMADWSWIGIGLGPSSIKTREVLGNPSLMPKRFPETRKISRGQRPREILRVKGNLEGRGDGFPNTSRVLVEDGHSLIINFSTGSGSGNPSLWTGKD